MPRPTSRSTTGGSLTVRDTKVRDWPHPRGPRHRKPEPYRWVVPAYPNRPSASRLPWKCSNVSSGGMSKWPHHQPELQSKPVVQALRSQHPAYPPTYHPTGQAWRRFGT